MILTRTAYGQQKSLSPEIYSGHYARQGNNDTPSYTINNNVYIKLFEDRWIALLYIPYPYAKTVSAGSVTRALKQAKDQTSTSAYIRSNFNEFSQPVTVHIERFGHLEDRIVFECGSLAPCTIRFDKGYLELIKPGVINEHIIRYFHVTDQ